MQPKIRVLRNGEPFIEFPLKNLPSGFSQVQHEARKAAIETEMEAVRQKVLKVLGSLRNIEFYLQIPSSGTRIKTPAVETTGGNPNVS